MQTTENIGLKKPEENDFYSIDDSNENMDIIDEEVQKLKTEIKEQVNGINTYLSNRVEEYADLALVDALTALCDNHMPTSGKPYNGIFKCTGGWYTYDIYYHGNYWSGHIVKHITGEFHSIYKAKDSAAVIANSFSDLKAAAFAGIANNCTTTAEGYVLAAQQGKELQDQITEQNNNLSNMFVTISFSGSKTAIGANSYANISATVATIPDGYTPIAVQSITSGNSKVAIGSFNCSSSTIRCNAMNTNDSSADATLSGKLLCVRTDFVE